MDKGAADALASGKSLLPAGVTRRRGTASSAAMPSSSANGEGVEIGRGLAAYDHSGGASRIIGRKSSEIAEILGYLGRPELIHRDDMALHRKSQRRIR